MNYTIKITENDKESRKIVAMIKELAGDNPFVSIYEDETGLSSGMEKELEMRYQQVLKNPTDGKSWDEVKTDLKKTIFGGDYAAMSGSCSSVYGLFKSEPQFSVTDFPADSFIWKDWI